MDFKNFLKSNSANFLTAGSCVGTVLTAIFAVKNTIDAHDDIENYKEGNGKILNVLKHYIPTGIVMVSSIGCSIGSNIIKTKQYDNMVASLATAASTLALAKSKNDPEYVMVETSEEDEFMNVPYELESDDLVWVFEDFRNNQFDSWAGWFKVNLTALRTAMYYTNRLFILRSYAGVSDFYNYIKIEMEDMGYQMDEHFAEYFLSATDADKYWSDDFAVDDGYGWIDFYEKHITDKNGKLKYIILSYPFEPRIDYDGEYSYSEMFC